MSDAGTSEQQFQLKILNLNIHYCSKKKIDITPQLELFYELFFSEDILLLLCKKNVVEHIKNIQSNLKVFLEQRIYYFPQFEDQKTC